MIFNRLNIKQELIKERSKQQRLLNDVANILNDSLEQDKDVLNRLESSDGKMLPNFLIAEESKKIFSYHEIKSICIRYRLRFLPTNLFKASFPYEAISRINELEKKLNTKIEDFRIIAPSKMFDLENINKDPILFAQLTDGRFYMIHKWGSDLKWYRKILTWPLQNFTTYFVTLWFFAAALAFGIPSSVMHQISSDSELFLRLWLTVHCFIAFMGLTFWLALSYEKTFSSLNWESKYYNW